MDKNNKSLAGMIAKAAQLIKTNKKIEYAVYAVIVALILLLYASSLGGQKQSESETTVQTLSAEREVEQRLEQTLGEIRGAGKVKVMITYASGAELVTAMTTDTSTNRSETENGGNTSMTEQQTQSQKPATVSGNGGTSPIIITQKQPEVRGVIVIAEGASDFMVKMNLQKAVQTVLDVPVSCIEVFESESK